MLVVSTVVAIISPLSSYLWWNKDWWLPPSILGGQNYTYIFAPEDVLLGFLFGGISAVIYEALFAKKVLPVQKVRNNLFGAVVVISLLCCSICFYFFNLNSFYSIIVAMISTVLLIVYSREDLLKSSFYSGILTLLILLPFYTIIYILDPQWAWITYKYDFLFGFNIFGFPIEEFIFWFFYGAAIGPLYEYTKGWGFSDTR